MAARKQPYAFLLLALSTLSFIINFSNAADCADAISVYWGQHSDETEGTLQEACDSGYYNIVILNQLIVYDDGSTPDLNLRNHCGSATNPCSRLANPIKHCQDLGIKVFLSIGIVLPTKVTRDRHSILASSSSSEDVNVTEYVADYIFENFLSGKLGPLGRVSLDGIDIQSVPEGKNIHWDELVKIIKGFTTEKKIYLSAAPQCVYPDYFLNAAIRTGLLDYIWVQFFYQNPCIYSKGDPANLLEAWDTWTSDVPESTIFLGLTASEEIPGYITPDELKSDVLPTVTKASNYGGVMIWDRYYDIQNNYSAQISCAEPPSTNFNGLKARAFLM